VLEASAAERDAVRALLAAARTQLGARATPTLLDRLGQTLRAAAVDEVARSLLERGRLTDELKAVGFGPLEAVKPTRRRSDEVGRAARERVTVLRAEARRLAEEAQDADMAADQAMRASTLLQEEAAQKRAAAERAAAELDEAEESLRKRR
jgi:fused signal recognition particle receptor